MQLVPTMIPFTVGSVSAPVTAMSASPPRTRREAAEGHFDRGPIVGVGD